MDAVDKTGEANFQRITGQFDPLFLLLESSPTSKVFDGLRERDGSVDKLLLNVKDSVSRSSQFDAATHDARVPLSKLTNSANSAIHSLQSLQSLSQLLNLCALISVHQNAGAISVAESFKIEHMKLTREQPESITQPSPTSLVAVRGHSGGPFWNTFCGHVSCISLGIWNTNL